MARDKSLQDRILEAIRDRLRARVVEWNEANCFVSDVPNPLLIPPSDSFCVIAPGEGTFPEEFFASAGENQLTEHTSVIVAPAVQYAIDDTGRLEHALLQYERGIFRRYKLEVLRALFRDSWEPEYGGSPLLRNMIRPMACSRPMLSETDAGLKYVRFELTVETLFDWEL